MSNACSPPGMKMATPKARIFTEKRKKRNGVAKIGYVAIYIGNNQMLHTYRQGKKVTITELNSYWKKNFIGAKRVLLYCE